MDQRGKTPDREEKKKKKKKEEKKKNPTGGMDVCLL
jgi:hypothetical protein